MIRTCPVVDVGMRLDRATIGDGRLGRVAGSPGGGRGGCYPSETKLGGGHMATVCLGSHRTVPQMFWGVAMSQPDLDDQHLGMRQWPQP